jgi:hypothetical protein
MSPIEMRNRYLPVKTERPYVFACFVNIVLIRVNAMNQVPLAGAQCGGELSVTAPNMYDQPSHYTGTVYESPG